MALRTMDIDLDSSAIDRKYRGPGSIPTESRHNRSLASATTLQELAVYYYSLSQDIFAAYFLKLYDIYEYLQIQLFIFRRKVIPDMYVLIVDGAVLHADMYAIKLIN